MSAVIAWLVRQWRLTAGAVGVLGALGVSLWLYLRGRGDAQDQTAAEAARSATALTEAQERAEEDYRARIDQIQREHPGDSGARERLLSEARAILDASGPGGKH